MLHSIQILPKRNRKVSYYSYYGNTALIKVFIWVFLNMLVIICAENDENSKSFLF